MRDPYSILGVGKSASEGDIKSAFRKLAKKYHPDANQDDPKAQERFAEVSRAYEIIGDAEKRKKFDRGEIDADGKDAFGSGYPGGNPFAGFEGFDFDNGRARRGSGHANHGGMNPEDILNTMFGGSFGGQTRTTAGGAGFSDLFGDPHGGPSRRSNPPKGKDIDVTLPLDLGQIVKGGKAKLALPDGRNVAVALPDYIEEGQVIRLKGQGLSGPAGHKGDVLATVAIKLDETTRLDGRNVIADIDVPLKTAIAGGKVQASTLDGKVALHIAPWTDSGHKMRLKGRGLPLKSGGRGDLTMRVNIVLSQEDRDALEAHYNASSQV